eukprot:6639006-Prymnesium_polylepis.1
MLAKQDMNFMAALESDDAPAWTELPYPPSGTIVGHSGRVHHTHQSQETTTRQCRDAPFGD